MFDKQLFKVQFDLTKAQLAIGSALKRFPMDSLKYFEITSKLVDLSIQIATLSQQLSEGEPTEGVSL